MRVFISKKIKFYFLLETKKNKNKTQESTIHKKYFTTIVICEY